MISYTFKYEYDYLLESGKIIKGFHLEYSTSGTINQDQSNIVWVFHALSANSNAREWWHGLVGVDKFFSPDKYFIICVNMPGSCYGSIGPLDFNPVTGTNFYHDFPLFTTRDMITAYKLLQEHLNIKKIFLGIGGSMGGQQLLEWAISDPLLFDHIVPIATNAFHSPWGIAFNASQRMCIESDLTWKDRNPLAGIAGMKVARSIALLSYRNYHTYQEAQQGVTSETKHKPVDELVFRAETYQQYQGEKMARRFNAFSYYFLSRTMDTHNVGRNRVSVAAALGSIKSKCLVIGIASDILFPPSEQEFIVKHIPDAQVEIIKSLYGHDGFLIEYEEIAKLIYKFLNEL